MSNVDWLQKDFYSTLGVGLHSSDAEIKKAYRALAFRHHPDLNAGDAAAEGLFKDIAEAFTVLSEQEDRRRYDEMRRAHSNGHSGYPGPADPFAPGWLRPEVTPRRNGNDIALEVVLSYRDARKGIRVDLAPCEAGRPARMVIVMIPAGVADGWVLNLKGRGGFGEGGGLSGNLIVTVVVLAPRSGRTELHPARAATHGRPARRPVSLPRMARIFLLLMFSPESGALHDTFRTQTPGLTVRR